MKLQLITDHLKKTGETKAGLAARIAESRGISFSRFRLHKQINSGWYLYQADDGYAHTVSPRDVVDAEMVEFIDDMAVILR